MHPDHVARMATLSGDANLLATSQPVHRDYREEAMIAIRYLAFLLASIATCTSAVGETLRLATWNLGWHVTHAELTPWISQCSKAYAKDADGTWKLVPSGTPESKRGWEIKESRAKLEGVDLSVMPPCAVYTTPTREGILVTPNAYTARSTQIGRLLTDDIKPDVIAFQEVSGSDAIREALGAASADYYVCSFNGAYKLQRLAFAWKKALGEAEEECSDIKALSLPNLPDEDQVRPGYLVTLKLAGKRVRFMTVHLKSSCVSPTEGDVLDGTNNTCLILEQQVAPLETAFEKLGAGVDHFVVLGDFNRNLWHEFNKVDGAEAIRSDGETDLTKPRATDISTRNLLLEVNDGAPASSAAELLPITCPGTSDIKAACEASKKIKLSDAERKLLSAPTGLGCRNPIGLDFILVSKSLSPAVRTVSKVAIGALGRSLAAKPPAHPEPLLAVSDHCPIVAEIDF